MKTESGHIRHSFGISVFTIFLFSWCIQPYNFETENAGAGIIVEAYISDVSYNESKNYPSDGRYFEVKLSETSEVTNIVNQPVQGAVVFLTDNLGNALYYTEDYSRPGIYQLLDEDFKAQVDVAYQLVITLKNGDTFFSSMEKLPESKSNDMGQISFSESKKLEFIYKAGEKTISEIDAIDISIDIPTNNLSGTQYSKWIFTATWVYEAPFTEFSDPTHKCWINDPFYLNDYQLNEVKSGNFKQYLTYIQTIGNERIYKKLSLLVTQFTMTPEYFNFWKELKVQSKRGQLFDPPPFNLKTNFKDTNDEKMVSGYFGVVFEQATRWTFPKDQLSYPVNDNTKEQCEINSTEPDPEGGPSCYDCLYYIPGIPTNIKPTWWID